MIITPCCENIHSKTMLIFAVNFFRIASKTFEVEQDCMLLQIIAFLLNYFCSMS